MPESTVGYHVLENTIVLSGYGKRVELTKGTASFYNALKAIKSGDTDSLVKYLRPHHELESKSGLRFYIDNGVLYFEDKPVEHRLVDIIISRYMSKDLPYEYLVEFLIRLMRNPSKNSRDQLYDFVSKNGMTITPDGFIIGYKAVTKDDKGGLVDIHTRRFPYVVGQYVQMDRRSVIDDRHTACGPGLHFGTWSYAMEFGTSTPSGHIMLELLIDPADVVSVPVDASYQKCRTCRMFISRVIEDPQAPTKANEEITVDKSSSCPPKCMDTKKEQNIVRIGNYPYTYQEVFADYVEKHKTYRKLVKSDFPKFFRDRNCTQVYREKRTVKGKNIFNYVVERGGSWIQYIRKPKK